MKENTDYKLLAKYLAGECTKKENLEIEKRVAEDTEYAKIIKEFRNIWNTKARPNPYQWDIEGVWDRVRKQMDMEQQKAADTNKGHARKTHTFRKPAQPPKRDYARFFRIAAVLLVGGFTSLVTILYMSDTRQEDPYAMREVVTERGQRATIHLDDGSRVQLNSESTLQHPGEFDDQARTVYLSGEGYFQIAHDDSRPFTVYTGETVIEIVGTEFNVRAYDDHDDIRVVVADGKVAVRGSRASYEESSFLERGDMGSVQRQNDGDIIIIQNVDLSQHLGWMEYRLSFENVPLQTVARTLERWYGVDIGFADERLQELKLTATFEDESIHEVLRVMNIALNVNHRIQGRSITFYE